MKAKDLVLLAFLSAILLVGQVTLAFLPNVEVVSFLIILYTIAYRKKVLYIIYCFALLEGLIYGFGIWWVMYLYVWTILAGITTIFRRNDSIILWAIISGAFGLIFGALCSIPYFIAGGWAMGFSYWVAGIPFDLIHCISNAAVMLILYKPCSKILKSARLSIN